LPPQVDAGIEALQDALRSGFDQYKVRTATSHVDSAASAIVHCGMTCTPGRADQISVITSRHYLSQVVREDPNLKKLRDDPRFDKTIDEYDEPVFNTGALKCAP